MTISGWSEFCEAAIKIDADWRQDRIAALRRELQRLGDDRLAHLTEERLESGEHRVLPLRDKEYEKFTNHVGVGQGALGVAPRGGTWMVLRGDVSDLTLAVLAIHESTHLAGGGELLAWSRQIRFMLRHHIEDSTDFEIPDEVFEVYAARGRGEPKTRLHHLLHALMISSYKGNDMMNDFGAERVRLKKHIEEVEKQVEMEKLLAKMAQDDPEKLVQTLLNVITGSGSSS